jgi:hypothetical protein
MAEKRKDHKGRSVYRSQFSMGALDFERLHKILQAMDLYGAYVWNEEEEAIRPFFALCKQFYKNIRHMVIDKKGMDAKFKSVKIRITNIEMLRTQRKNYQFLLPEVFDGLDEISDKIYELKQWLGLGIEIEKVLSQKKKWERAMRISGD